VPKWAKYLLPTGRARPYISLDARFETTQLDCINMAGAAIVDIRTTFGATFVGLLVSTTSVLLWALLHPYHSSELLSFQALWFDTCADVSSSKHVLLYRANLAIFCSYMTYPYRWMYFWSVVRISECKKLTSLRKYRNRDPKPLKIFIAFISCVLVWINFWFIQSNVFIRAMDVLHTITSAYMNYW
jgi:hypothetical protein